MAEKSRLLLEASYPGKRGGLLSGQTSPRTADREGDRDKMKSQVFREGKDSLGPEKQIDLAKRESLMEDERTREWKKSLSNNKKKKR